MIPKICKRDLFILAFLLSITTYYPYFFVGFTTNDDTLHSLHFLKESNLISDSLSVVTDNSIVRPLYAFFYAPPYFFDNFFYFKFVQLSASFFSVVFCAYFIKNLTSSPSFAALFFVVFLTFLQNSWNHNIMTSYPFYYHSSLIFLILSFVALIKYIEQKKTYLLISSYVLFFIILMNYEMYLVYTPVYFILLCYFGNKYKIQVKKRALILVPYTLSALFLIALYFFVKIKFGIKYDGNTIDPKSTSGVLSVLWQYSISAVPTYVYNNIYWLYSGYTFGQDVVSNEPPSFLVVLKKIELVWLFKAFIASSLVFLFFSKLEKIDFKLYLWIAFFSFIYIILPNLPLSLIPKYQLWVANNDISYITTHYSYFAVILFLVVLLGIVKNLLDSKVKFYIFSGFLVMFTAYSSIVTDYANSYVFKTQYQARAKWKLVDKFLSSSYFSGLPDGSTIVAPSLWKKYAILENSNNYWSAYFKQKSGKIINVIRDIKSVPEHNNNPLFFMKFNQQSSYLNQFIVIGKIEVIRTDEISNKPKFYSNKIVVYDTSKYNYEYILGELGKDNKEITINEKKYVVKNNKFMLPFRFLYDKDSELKMIVIKSKEIAINTINLTA